MITLDFSNVKERVPLAEGIYDLTVIEASEGTSKTGNPKIEVVFEEAVTKNRLWENYPLSEKSLFKIKQLTDAIGIEQTGPFQLDVADLIGATVKAKVVQEEYNEEIVNRIKKIFAN